MTEWIANTLQSILDFSNILNVSITASWLVIAVVVLRFLLKNSPKWTHVALWGLVAVRLLLPFSIESSFSLIFSTETIPQEILKYEGSQLNESAYLDVVSNPLYLNDITVDLGQTVNRVQVHMVNMTFIWLTGIFILFLYSAISYWRLHRRIDTAVLYRDNIFQSENAISPFVFGLIKPKIYLPFKIDVQNLEHIVAHEQAHIRRKDYWWKPLGFLLLTIHWFNPIMWLAYVLLCHDIELACDEKVIKELDNEQRANYTQALVACSVSRRMIAACPLAFGEIGVKERVENILKYRKPTFFVIVSALIICTIMAVCFLTNPKKMPDTFSGPFGHTYYVADVYLSAGETLLNFVPTENTTPLYCFTSDSVLRNTIVSGMRYENWRTLGSLEKITLTADNFDSYFKDDSSANELRNSNKHAWQLLTENGSYYLLQQRSGDIYLAYWDEYFPAEYVVQLNRADYVTCMIETYEESAFYEMEWYPGEEHYIFHGDIPVYVMNGEGTLVFHVDDSTDTLTIKEECYSEYPDGSFSLEETENYTLFKNSNGNFTLKVSPRNSFSTYYVDYKDSIYAVKIDFE